MQMTFNDRNTGQPLLTAEVPEEFASEAYLNLEQYPSNRILKVYGKTYKNNCVIYYLTSDCYILSRRPQNGFFQAFGKQDDQQNESGHYYAQLYGIKTDLDMTAANLLQKQI